MQVTQAVHDARTAESSCIQECDEHPDAFGEEQPVRCLSLFMVAHDSRRSIFDPGLPERAGGYAASTCSSPTNGDSSSSSNGTGRIERAGAEVDLVAGGIICA